MELSANRKRRPAPDFITGQQVWLLRRNISTTRPSSKLDVRRLGPFPIIEQVGTSAFRLDLQARTTSRRHARWAATLAAYDYTIIYRKGASNGKADALSRNPDFLPPPLPSLPISSPSDPILNSPHLLQAAVLVMPNDPLLPAIAAAQAADPILSAHIQQMQRGPGGESNPALPEGSPIGRVGSSCLHSSWGPTLLSGTHSHSPYLFLPHP